eukprot:TRINITY_DN3832_c0_g2_i6.p1 TRINITY_DN3832_c0_g2~~TRINITY_DN3832_c0_g2_i6.p1  ORF type:complete len:692 (-),score=164.16 TRINITY_DN3832_c0_g2_i6:169-2244(-)
MEPTNEGKVTLSVTPESSSVSADVEREMLLMVSVKAPLYQLEQRSSVDVVSVIDRSGSMDGERLRLVKEAMFFVVHNLTHHDRLGIVSYEGSVTVEMPFVAMDERGKEMARSAIRGIVSTGSTNLCGGLIGGIKLIKSLPTRNPVGSVLLFTDGQANIGFRDAESIITQMYSDNPTDGARNTGSSRFGYGTRYQAAEPEPEPKLEPERPTSSGKLPCTVNTFGFGQDHEASLLQKISEAGNGMYYFIQNKDLIAEAFVDCLGGLLSVAAQNLEITIEVEGEVQIKKVHTSYKMETIEPGKHLKLKLPDIQSEERKDILFNLLIPKAKATCDTFPVARITLNYFNCISSLFDSSMFTSNLSRPEVSIPQPRDKFLDEQLNRNLAADATEQADLLAKKGNLNEARELLSKVIREIEESVSRDTEFSVNLVQDLKKCLSALEDSSSYTNVGSKMLHGHGQAQRYQRSNVAPSSGLRSQTCYANTTKSRMQAEYQEQQLQLQQSLPQPQPQIQAKPQSQQQSFPGVQQHYGYRIQPNIQMPSQPSQVPQQVSGEASQPLQVPQQVSGEPSLPLQVPQQVSGEPSQPLQVPQQVSGEASRPVEVPQQASGEPSLPLQVPQQVSGEPSQAIEVPQQVSGEPSLPLEVPQQVSGEPSQAIEVPQQVSGEPSLPLEVPQQVSGEPSRPTEVPQDGEQTL